MQTGTKEFKSAGESGRAKRLETGLRKRPQMVAVIIISTTIKLNNVRLLTMLCTLLHIIIVNIICLQYFTVSHYF